MNGKKYNVIYADPPWSYSKTRIEKINPNYQFTMHANPVINGIMAATVK